MSGHSGRGLRRIGGMRPRNAGFISGQSGVKRDLNRSASDSNSKVTS
jgi:hypothetical protein